MRFFLFNCARHSPDDAGIPRANSDITLSMKSLAWRASACLLTMTIAGCSSNAMPSSDLGARAGAGGAVTGSSGSPNGVLGTGGASIGGSGGASIGGSGGASIGGSGGASIGGGGMSVGSGGVAGSNRGAGGVGGGGGADSGIPNPKALAASILADADIATTKMLCQNILASGFDAGSGYPQVWIRDMNTFIEVLLEKQPSKPVRVELVKFFLYQGGDFSKPPAPSGPYVNFGTPSGNIVDGYYPSNNALFKNTAETDQETSLIQAVRKYVDNTGDSTILSEVVNGRTVSARMGDALDYLLTNRLSAAQQLIWG